MNTDTTDTIHTDPETETPTGLVTSPLKVSPVKHPPDKAKAKKARKAQKASRKRNR